LQIVITLGIDLAAQPKNTSACLMNWRDGIAEVSRVVCDLDDRALLNLFPGVDKAGIDVPFGWPSDFVDAISKHRELRPWPTKDRLKLCLRETDLFVREKTGLRPLSVATDRIGVTAMRGAALLSLVGEPVDRSGRGTIVEVYPAAALQVWGFDPRGYKGKKGQQKRSSLVGTFLQRANGWLTMHEKWRTACTSGDNEFDAFIAAMVARASAVGLAEPLPLKCVSRVSTEGWIALPVAGSLEKLASSP
jgi:hypothetical protein